MKPAPAGLARGGGGGRPGRLAGRPPAAPKSGLSGTASGHFTVLGLVKFDVAPGSLPPGFVDNIGDPANTRSGLAILRVGYQDNSRGILVISCHQPVGSPSGIFEGITATKGFVDFREPVPPVPGVNANRNLFHVVP